MTPTAEYLAECGRRILAVTPRGVPRRQFDNLAAECGIVIGKLCQTTHQAHELTEQLVAHPLPRWDFRAFQERAAKFRQPNTSPSTAEAQAAQERHWQARYERAQRTFRRRSAHRQREQLEAKHAELTRRLVEDGEAWINPPAGGNFKIQTLFNMPPGRQQALIEDLVTLDIMTEIDLVATSKMARPARAPDRAPPKTKIRRP